MNLTGLTDAQVADKIRQGKVNHAPKKARTTIPKIILRNTLTIFNFVNLVLAILIILVGSYKNLLFILIAIANTLISIINEIRAKKTVDKMRLLSEQKPTVIRNGQIRQIDQSQIVEGDLLVYSLGDQIIVDSRIEQGTVEVNEAFTTGEQDNIEKHPGDQLTSGSFIVSGTCKAVATSVGEANFINKLESNAHTIKTADSKLFTIMNNIVKYISFALIPIGALLLWSRFRIGSDTEVAVTSTVAALINMIPEGLILLTSSVLALATIRLSRKKVLVQDLYSIETLARVDTIALDKTGTLTTGKMTVHSFVLPDGTTFTDSSKSRTPAEKSLQDALKLILSTDTANNATSTAIKAKLLGKAKFKPKEQIKEVIPFSSDRKYSGVVTDKATYLMGALEFITDEKPNFSGEYRVLAVVKCEEYPRSRSIFADGANTERPSPVTTAVGAEQAESLLSASRRRTADDIRSTGTRERSENDGYSRISAELLGYVLLEDELRPDAKEIIAYFYDNDVDVKIISGDNLTTVQTIATQTGVKHTDRAVDLSTLDKPNYSKLVQDYTIFTRVTPSQKKNFIKALKKQGKTVAMTGDGVNDILAMKEADVSLAIGEGSDAARRAAKMVLLNSDFSSVPSIIDEGRQSINNLERSTTLFLSKTIYASILAVLFTILPLEYPYAPIEMSLLNFACIGLPGVILALETNTSRIKHQFVTNIKKYSIPTGITVSISMLVLAITASVNHFTRPELLTASLFITFIIDLTLIYQISKPLNLLRATLLTSIIIIVVGAFLLTPVHDLLDIGYLSGDPLLITTLLTVASLALFALLRHFTKILVQRQSVL